ncbi:YesL family protein [Alkalicoccobacillus plakortidis]|uniref:YesL family protein n=1 Tax=Alkalicoccobacillus plakortidis TaxID=444060 RepID=A0ABT0XK59_9BACI|nr:YesL family protein [Alkalicoccobacillus plakortidis]MCM2676283.1 YesL family protein [Alkalicoccobacillus plakortidis]
MEMPGIWGSFYRISTVIYKLAYVNFLWLLFTIVGLVAFGLMPATISLFTVCKKWMQGSLDIPVFQTFWSNYKTEFLKSNGLGFGLLLVGFLIYWNLTLFTGMEWTYVVIRYSMISLGIAYAIMVIFLFPTYVSFEVAGLDRIKTSLALAFGHPHFLILILVGLYALQALFMTVPGLILFFGAAVPALFLMWIFKLVHHSLERKAQEAKV